jgi:hypothetical protein
MGFLIGLWLSSTCRLRVTKGGGRMNEQDIQDILVALLTEDSVQLGERGADAEPTFEAVSTFEEAGVASDDKGLVISTGDGSVFLVTIERGR